MRFERRLGAGGGENCRGGREEGGIGVRTARGM